MEKSVKSSEKQSNFSKKAILEIVKQPIESKLSSMNVELVDIEFEKKYGEDNLTVYIYIDGGVTLDDCERVHISLDSLIDELDPTQGSPFVFNVSSPGLDRPFVSQRDFERNYNSEVEIKLYAPLRGKKSFEGILIDRTKTETIIKVEQEEQKFPNNKIALVRPLVKF
jgi:ribosome maturation factor RimP